MSMDVIEQYRFFATPPQYPTKPLTGLFADMPEDPEPTEDPPEEEAK